jgi:uncharacterized membrane protein
MKLGTMLGWAGLGAGLMYMFDARSGSRRRAVMRDRITRALHKTGDAVDTTARDVKHRSQGVVATVGSLFRSSEAPDRVLVERVRARLGRVVSHPKSLEVTANDGHVTLRGPILAHEVDNLISAVSSVRGVKGVDSQLEVHKQPGDVPGLQGGGRRIGDRFELMQEHWSPSARLFVGAGGAGMILAGLNRGAASGVALTTLGAVLLARAATNLEMKRLVGVGAGRRAVDVQKTISIDAPVEDVFAFWSDLENHPRFMSNVRSVRPTAVAGQTHWTVAGPGGIPVEFDVVVTDMVPNELLAWKSIPGSMVDHAGIVRFQSTPDGGTVMHFRISYNPPGGAIGHGVTALLGQDLKRKLDEDLLRFKTLMETGKPPHDAADRGRSTGEVPRVH